MPTIQRETGLNLPNVMTPGAWVIVGVVVLAALIGIGTILWKVWTRRVKWQPLLLGYLGIQYFAVNNCVPADRLRMAVDKARAYLILNSKWPTSQVERALGGFNIYVFDDDVNAGKVGRFGYQSGNIIGVNRKLTTLCHEMGHLLHERVENIADYYHTRWDADGFTAAEKAYDDWLSS